MTNQSFQSWLAGLDRLSAAQWSQLQQAVQERSEGAAAVAAIELQIDTERRCPHCQAGAAAPRAGCAATVASAAARPSMPSAARRCRDCTTRSAGWRWDARWWSGNRCCGRHSAAHGWTDRRRRLGLHQARSLAV